MGSFAFVLFLDTSETFCTIFGNFQTMWEVLPVLKILLLSLSLLYFLVFLSKGICLFFHFGNPLENYGRCHMAAAEPVLFLTARCAITTPFYSIIKEEAACHPRTIITRLKKTLVRERELLVFWIRSLSMVSNCSYQGRCNELNSDGSNSAEANLEID